MTATPPARAMRLARIAPWNTELRATGARYVHLDGRRFTAEHSNGLWTVWEVADNGLPDPAAVDEALVAIAFNLPAVRLAITMRLAGVTEAAIRAAMIDAPSAGTGRNAPANVARRRNRSRH